MIFMKIKYNTLEIKNNKTGKYIYVNENRRSTVD